MDVERTRNPKPAQIIATVYLCPYNVLGPMTRQSYVYRATTDDGRTVSTLSNPSLPVSSQRKFDPMKLIILRILSHLGALVQGPKFNGLVDSVALTFAAVFTGMSSNLAADVTTHRYKRHRFPAEIIAHAVWLYVRFRLSLRHVEDLLAERGIEVSL
jgi:hypothetical protein